jgi:low affinity Fe/Cu permease
MAKRERFRRLALLASQTMGTPWAFMAALAIVVGWLATGPLFGFSDTWQLIINTGTTIVTFLMVFLIQATQNRDAKALHLKLDELLRAVKGAREELEDLEDASDEEIRRYDQEFRRHH